MVGQRSTDEMGNLWLQVLPHSDADRSALAKAFMAHEAQANVAGAEMLVRHDPASADNQIVPRQQLRRRRPPGRGPAAFRVRAAASIPGRRAAHNELAGALLKLRRVPEAIAHFRQAAALSPRDERMHYNLGRALPIAGAGRGGRRRIPARASAQSRSRRGARRARRAAVRARPGAARRSPTSAGPSSWRRDRRSSTPISAARWPSPAGSTRRCSTPGAPSRSTPISRPRRRISPASRPVASAEPPARAARAAPHLPLLVCSGVV